MNFPSNPTLAMQSERLEMMSRVIWAIPRIYHRLTGISERIYAQYDLTAGKRSLLQDLVVRGPHTIAEMVRVRPPVTRQYIQRLVSELRQTGMVELSQNPDDRRSKVVRLTDKGRQVIDKLIPAEQELIQRLIADHDKPQLEAARNVLESVAGRLEESDFWTQQMDKNR